MRACLQKQNHFYSIKIAFLIALARAALHEQCNQLYVIRIASHTHVANRA